MTLKKPNKKNLFEPKPNQALEPKEAASPEIENTLERNTSMFKDWLMGKTYAAIGKDYNLNINTVWQISKKYKWPKLKDQMIMRRFKQTMNSIRGAVPIIHEALVSDVKRIIADVEKHNRVMTKEERSHVLSFYDRMLKESRLEEGVPTEVGFNGPTETRIILPAGVKHFGLIPPNPNVKYLEQAKDQGKDDTIDLDQVENDLEAKQGENNNDE